MHYSATIFKCSYHSVDYYYYWPADFGWNEFCSLEFSTRQIEFFDTNFDFVLHRDQNMTAPNIRHKNFCWPWAWIALSLIALPQKQNSIIFNFGRQHTAVVSPDWLKFVFLMWCVGHIVASYYHTYIYSKAWTQCCNICIFVRVSAAIRCSHFFLLSIFASNECSVHLLLRRVSNTVSSSGSKKKMSANFARPIFGNACRTSRTLPFALSVLVSNKKSGISFIYRTN